MPYALYGYLCSMIKSTLLKATETAGKILQQYFYQSYSITSKGTINDLVTEVDKHSEAAIINIIKNDFPDHQILSEEIGEIRRESDYKWIIDPIDGTVNFAHRIPLCCISIAVEKEGEVLMGAVYNPFLNELFFAQRGFGATLNDKKISVSDNADPSSAFLVTGFPYRWMDMPNDPVEVFGRFIKNGVPVRRLGSAAIDLCWVACGRFDGFWEHYLNPWDVAAGFLIVEEAGGRVTDHDGLPYTPYAKKLLATNGRMHDPLLKVLNEEI
jgi:myo-inositol-1(or 4)-monophosphatase